MLLVKGLIFETDKGKKPTARGVEKGLELKADFDANGREYCYPIYSDNAARYVKQLALAYLAEETAQAEAPVLADANQPTPAHAVSSTVSAPVMVAPAPTAEMSQSEGAKSQYRFTHNDYRAAKRRNRDCLVLLESPYDYRTYFRDARRLSGVLHLDVYKNRRDIPGISFPKSKIGFAQQALDDAGIPWVICTPEGEYRAPSAAIGSTFEESEDAASAATVEVGREITVRVNNSDRRSFFLVEGNAAPIVAYVNEQGMVTGTEMISFDLNTVSTESPVGAALLGRRVGETIRVTVGGTTSEYTITNIE